ncbi:hypothetical protein MBAV_003236, partial [Candidatus Magnetobacterium bavaricum]
HKVARLLLMPPDDLMEGVKTSRERSGQESPDTRIDTVCRDNISSPDLQVTCIVSANV